MRKIEKQMLAAVCTRRNWSSGNTFVKVSSDKNIVNVFLHGNLIYKLVGTVESFTLAGWDTVTTRSRLNALGCNIFHRNRKPYAVNLANAIEIDVYSWYNL